MPLQAAVIFVCPYLVFHLQPSVLIELEAVSGAASASRAAHRRLEAMIELHAQAEK